jgi:hypothetical protein
VHPPTPAHGRHPKTLNANGRFAAEGRSLTPRSSPADRQQAVLQRLIHLQLGTLTAENDAAAIEHHGIFGEGQGEVGFLFG